MIKLTTKPFFSIILFIPLYEALIILELYIIDDRDIQTDIGCLCIPCCFGGVFEAVKTEQWGSCAGLCLKWNI